MVHICFYRIFCLVMLVSLSQVGVSQNSRSISLDGIDDYLDVSHHQSLDFGNGSFTLACWFKKPTSTHSLQVPLVGNLKLFSGQPAVAQLVVLPSGGLNFMYRTSANQEVNLLYNNPLDDNQWHFAAAVYDSAKDSTAIFVDIDFVAFAAVPSGNKDSYQGFTFGGNHLGRFMSVKLDEVSIWSKALTSSELLQIKNCTADIQDPQLKLYFQFEEGAGTTTADLSGQSNVGSLVNGPTWSADVPLLLCAPCYDTIAFFDTTAVLVYDTVPVFVFDTVQVIDSVVVSIIDTVRVVDTIYVTISDTIVVYDTLLVSVADTLVIDAVLTGGFPQPATNAILLYPNPALTHLVIDFGNYQLMAGYRIEIRNQLAQLVYSANITQSQDLINLSSWTGPGLYHVYILDPFNSVVESSNIVIQ